MTFGKRLMQLRKEHGYRNRDAFAAELGIPANTLRNYEMDSAKNDISNSPSQPKTIPAQTSSGSWIVWRQQVWKSEFIYLSTFCGSYTLCWTTQSGK